MTTSAKPVAFEIEVAKNSPSQDPAVKKRLEEHCQAAPSLEDIRMKLERAEAKRGELTKKALTDDKVVEVRWRKSTREAQQIARFKKGLLKLESADETRQRHLRTKIEKAQRNSCLLVVERKNTELASLAEKTKQKLEVAEKLRLQGLKNVVDIAHKNSEKLEKALQKKQELEQEKVNKAQEELNKVEARSSVSPNVAATKAKQHLAKVDKVVSAHKERQLAERENLKSKYLLKHSKAEERRGSVLDKVKQTAQEVGQGRSRSNQQACSTNANSSK
jgi:hypothetical protein